MLRFYEDYYGRLEKLHAEVRRALAGLPPPALDWSPGPDMNSLTVLVVHLTGAERYWIGDVAAGEPSDRDRSAEFEVRGLDAGALEARLDATLAYSRRALEILTLADLQTERFSPLDGRSCTIAWALMHALEHTGLHTGHVQLMRQLLKAQRQLWYNFTVADDE